MSRQRKVNALVSLYLSLNTQVSAERATGTDFPTLGWPTLEPLTDYYGLNMECSLQAHHVLNIWSLTDGTVLSCRA